MPRNESATIQPQPLLVDATQAARALGVSARTIWQLGHDGEIPIVRVRGRTLYDPRDLAAFVERCKGGPARQRQMAEPSASERVLRQE